MLEVAYACGVGPSSCCAPLDPARGGDFIGAVTELQTNHYRGSEFRVRGFRKRSGSHPWSLLCGRDQPLPKSTNAWQQCLIFPAEVTYSMASQHMPSPVTWCLPVLPWPDGTTYFFTHRACNRRSQPKGPFERRKDCRGPSQFVADVVPAWPGIAPEQGWVD